MIRLSRLTKCYGGRPVVDDVSLELPKGKVISFIGPNGAGKSTVLSVIARLTAATSGTAEIDGRDVRHWNSRELARRLAVLTQSNSIQMKLTVRELVLFGRFPHSGTHPTAEDREIADRAVRAVELEAFADRFIDEMSGGQRQRAFIAMVLAQDTDYILLDEPTNNLDIYHAAQMMKLVRRLCDEFGKTVILVLHEINLAAFYSDLIIAFADGRIAAQGSPDEVICEKTLRAVYGADFAVHRIDGRPFAVYH